ncbi:MAG: flagellar motor protein MotD [Candidatus Sedimenticola sp. PURPLELP]
MARKKRQEEHENYDRWIVSYADFITLLFAFFVVMYAISSVNEGKYRVLSDTLTDAFREAALTVEPIQVGEEPLTTELQPGEYAPHQIPGEIEPLDEGEEAGVPMTGPYEPPLSAIATRLEDTLSGFAEQDLVNISHTDRGVEVEMKSKMLYTSGSARLSREAVAALRDVAIILKPLINQINVEGHTDNIPIETVTFPSNWELSAARAASVVHLFTRLGVDPGRMAAIGYGEHQPLETNDTEVGRQANRRVALIILTSKHEREQRELNQAPRDAGASPAAVSVVANQ